MEAKEVLAIAMNRGLQPNINEFGGLEFDGNKKLLTSGLQAVIDLHATDIKRLLASKWTPGVKGQGVVEIVQSDSHFDWDAERLVRDLYATDHGVSWDHGKMSIYPRDGDPRLDQWLKRAMPLRDRIEAHIRPRDTPTPETVAECKRLGIGKIEPTHGIELKHADHGKTYTIRRSVYGPDQGKGKKKTRGPFLRYEDYETTPNESWVYVVEADHIFDFEPPVGFSAWRYMMDNCDHWRMLWGHWEHSNHAISVWHPWGSRTRNGERYA